MLITGSIQLLPIGYDSNRSRVQNIANPDTFVGKSSSNNGYTQITLVNGSNATTEFWITFDASSIPDNATITSVEAKVKTYSNGNANQVKLRQARGYIGDNTKGFSSTLTRSTVQVTTLDLGSGGFDRSDLQDFMIRLYFQRGTSNVTSNYYIRLYGAEVNVEYEYDDGTGSSSYYIKKNNVWIPVTKVYEKINGSWVEQTDFTFDNNKIYITDE